jgi:hypothetical protein
MNAGLVNSHADFTAELDLTRALVGRAVTFEVNYFGMEYGKASQRNYHEFKLDEISTRIAVSRLANVYVLRESAGSVIWCGMN